MFCTNCGKEIEDDTIYCNYCGTFVKQEKEEEIEIFKISSTKLYCLVLLIIGFIVPIVNIVSSQTTNRDFIQGQLIYAIIFAITAILFWKSYKISIYILLIFIPFKMISTIYYYFEMSFGLKNIVLDEFFYLLIVIAIILDLKYNKK